MKRNLLLTLIGAACSLCAASVLAQTTPGATLFNPTMDLSAGAQNTHVGSAGGVFLTSHTLWPYFNWLGYYDKGGDGLVNSHEISVWHVGGTGTSTPVEVAHVTVPAGTDAPLINGYRWVQLPTTVGMWYGAWYTIAAQTDGVDTWGDMISSDSSQLTWNTDYVGDNGGWSRAARYDTAASWPNSPGTQMGNNAILPAANLGYNLVVPEPSSFALLALGAATLLGLRRKHS